MTTSQPRVYVLAYGRSYWVVRREGQISDLSVHAGRAEAERAAKAQDRREKTAPAGPSSHGPAGTAEYDAPSDRV